MPKELLLLIDILAEDKTPQAAEYKGNSGHDGVDDTAAFAIFDVNNNLVSENRTFKLLTEKVVDGDSVASAHSSVENVAFAWISTLSNSFDDRFIMHDIEDEMYLCFFCNSSQLLRSPDNFPLYEKCFSGFPTYDDLEKDPDVYAYFVFFIKVRDIYKSLSEGGLISILHHLAELKQTDREYDLMFDNVFDLLTITDGDGVLLKTNSAIEKVFGLSREEAIGYSVHDLEKNGVLSKSITKEVLLRKHPMTLIQDTQTGRRLVVNSTPMFDSNGQIYKIFNTSQDITTLKSMEEKLAQAEDIIKEHEHRISIFRKSIESPNFMMTSSIQMREIFETVHQITNVDSTVLIEGETGVGKGYLAKQIHDTSTRKDGPFIHVNCGAIPSSLLESELFGYEKGAFTGALESGKDGLVDAAEGGTLFLDEISEIPMSLQAKILELIQTKSYYRIGTNSPRKSSARIIAATNRDLKQMVSDGEFREDLYYRLNVIPLYMPPLRERRSEIQELANTFVKQFNEKYGLSRHLGRDAVSLMINAEWPGNIRELENLIERLVVTCKSSIIGAEDLPPSIKDQNENSNAIDFSINKIIPLKDAQKQLERVMIDKALELYPSKSSAAQALGVHRTTILRKMDDDQS